jgi:hypothetical protein
MRIYLPCERLERAATWINMSKSSTPIIAKNITYLAKRYAVPYQPTSSREWKWPVISGIACEIYVLNPIGNSRNLLTNRGKYGGIKQ